MGKVIPLTTKEKKMINELIAQGNTIKQVAEKIGRSTKAVFTHTEKHNHKVTKEEVALMQRLWDEGETLKYIGYKLKRNPITVARYINTGIVHNRWSKNEKQMAHRLLSEGKSHREIAQILNRTQAAIRQFFRYERIKNTKIIKGGCMNGQREGLG